MIVKKNDQDNEIKFLINAISQQTSFSDMLKLYYFNQKILKGWTFIISTTEPNNVDLYAGMEEIEGVRDRMFTPFANGRVNIINDKIIKRYLIKNDAGVRMYRCVSFDTQTVSYIERYYKKGTVPYKGFDAVVCLLKGESIGIDPIPYTLENLLFDSSRKDSVERTLFTYEMMCGENAGNEKVCKRRIKAILSMYEHNNSKALSFTKELYNAIYLSLLKMCQIQLQHGKMSADKKLEMYVEFIATKLCRVLQPEINLAYTYFKKGSSCGFFGKIHNGNIDALEQLKNMTWDLMHLRFMNYSSTVFNTKKGDALIPYFYTYDKRLIDVRECYSLKMLAINMKRHSVVPIYALADGILNVIDQYCTFEKHNERMLKTPDINQLIAQYEQELIELI